MKLVLLLLLTINAYAISKRAIKEHAAEFTNYPSTILAIAGVESTYGKNILGDDGHSLGLMQIWIPTALFIAKRDASLAWLLHLPTKTLETILLKNDALSIEIACKLFEYNRKRYGYKMAIIRYNGMWEVNKHGKAIKDKDGNKVVNIQYYDKVKAEMLRNQRK